MSRLNDLDIELSDLVGQAVNKGASTFNDIKIYVNNNKSYDIIPDTWIKDKYKELFGDNFFHVISTDEDFDASIAEIQPRVNAFLKQVNEDFQQDVKKQHKKMKIRLIGLGGNKKKEDPYVKNPSMKRSKSAPHGFGGS